MRSSSRPPGVSDIVLLNGLLGASCFLVLGLWMVILLQLGPYLALMALGHVVPALLVALFMAYPKTCLAGMALTLILVGLGLRFYLKRFSLRSGWLLPVFHLLVSLVFGLFVLSLLAGMMP